MKWTKKTSAATAVVAAAALGVPLAIVELTQRELLNAFAKHRDEVETNVAGGPQFRGPGR